MSAGQGSASTMEAVNLCRAAWWPRATYGYSALGMWRV